MCWGEGQAVCQVTGYAYSDGSDFMYSRVSSSHLHSLALSPGCLVGAIPRQQQGRCWGLCVKAGQPRRHWDALGCDLLAESKPLQLQEIACPLLRAQRQAWTLDLEDQWLCGDLPSAQLLGG